MSKQLQSDGIVIFSGYNPRGVLAFLRTLNDLSIDKYIIVARNREDEIFDTKYRNDVFYVRNNNALALDEFATVAEKIKREKGWKQFVIAPSTEFLNRFILIKSKELKTMGYIVPLVNKETYENISDKKSFGDICKNNGIVVPSIIEFPRKFESPFVAKPITYVGKSSGKIFNPVLIYDEGDYIRFIDQYDRDDFYYQEMITGNSFYLLYYFSLDGSVFKLSQENLIQQANGKSIIAAKISDLYKKLISEDYVKLFKKMSFYGLVMVEIREKDGVDYMIEANPRFWGPSQLFVDSGYNFFWAMLHDWGFTLKYPSENLIRSNTLYCWHGGVVEDQEKHRTSVCYDGFDIELVNSEEWKKSDIYNRKDTTLIWKKTLKKAQ